MAKDKSKPKPLLPEPAAPSAEEVTKAPDVDPPVKGYTEHLLVTLDFMERYGDVVQWLNNARRRKGLNKVPLGWYAVKNLEEWLTVTEALMKQGPATDPPSS